MQEINLLQNKLKDKTDSWEKQNRVVNVILFLVLIAEIVAAGMFFMLKSSAQENTSTLTVQNTNLQQQLDQQEDDLALARGLQAQATNIAQLLDSHVIWSSVFEEINRHTFQLARYLHVSSDTTGTIHIEGVTRDYTDLGKLILSLETSDQFSSVKLVSTAPAKDQIAGVIFVIDLNVNRQLFLAKNQ